MISIIIPTFNNASTIKLSIKSVLNQTINDYEIIVVDDGSTDDTYGILKEYIDKGLLQYYKKNNGGCASALNYGINIAKGNYVAFLDADDEFLSNHLENALSLLIKGRFDWVAGGYYQCQKDGITTYKSLKWNSLINYDYESSTIKLLDNGLFWFSSVPILVTTLLYKKDVLQNIGYFDITARYSEDWDLFLRTEEAGYRGGYIDEPQAIYNFSPLGITKSKTFDVLTDHLILACKHAKILGIEKNYVRKSYSAFCWHAGSTFIDMKYYSAAARCFFESMKYDFSLRKLFKPISVITKNFVSSKQ